MQILEIIPISMLVGGSLAWLGYWVVHMIYEGIYLRSNNPGRALEMDDGRWHTARVVIGLTMGVGMIICFFLGAIRQN